MKKFGILLILGLLFSCNTTKELPPPPTLDDSIVYLGTIKLGNACGTLIEITNPEGSELLKPMNLEAKFEKEGLRIKFRYQWTKQKKPTNCEKYPCVDLIQQYAVR